MGNCERPLNSSAHRFHSMRSVLLAVTPQDEYSCLRGSQDTGWRAVLANARRSWLYAPAATAAEAAPVSALSIRRKKMGYTVKRCATCANFREGYVYLTTDSQTRRAKPLCKAGEFTISPHGVCNEWRCAGPNPCDTSNNPRGVAP